MHQISKEGSFDSCVEKYREHFGVDGFTEDKISVKSKEGVIINKTNEKTVEIREVEHLDTEIKSNSKASSIIQELHKKRKLRHEKLMKKLACDLNDVNVKVEKNIRISSEEVKAHMKNYKDQLSEKLKNLNSPEVASYHPTVFLNIQKEVDNMKSHQLKLIEELYNDLLKFEKERSKENERIFQLSFKEIEKTAHILPYELQNIIEHEALKMNQLSLNNRRCYEDLKLKLTLVTEQTFKSFMDEVFCLKEKWLRYNQENIHQQHEQQLEKELTCIIHPEPQTRIEVKGHWLSLTLTSDKCFNIVNSHEFFRNVIDISNVIENNKAMIIDLYQQIITAVEKDLRNEYEELRKSLLCLDILQFEKRTIQPIMFKISNLGDENIQLTELRWQSFLQVVSDELNNAYKCLKNFGELWNRHVSRLCESKILVLKAAEKVAENNAISSQELEVKVNLSLDALRQEYNEANLDTMYIATIANLDAIKKKLESDYIDEVTVIEDYYKMMNLEADVLSAEIKEFIFLNMSELPESEDQSIEMIPEYDEGVTDAIGYCIKMEEILSEIRYLKLYKNNFGNVLENLAANTRERVASRAGDWVRSKIQDISRKYQTLLEMHHKRYDRIRIQMYEVRREEIYLHQRVFQEHKTGVEDFYKKLTKMLENYYDKFMEKLEENRTNVTSSIADTKEEKRASAVRCIQTQIQKQKTELMTEVTMKTEQTNQEIEFLTSSIQQSNLKFMKSIKLFHENGNYDVDEAKSYITLLENLDKEISNEMKLIIKELKKKEAELLQKISEFFDEAIQTLIKLNEELQFYASVRNIFQSCKNDLCNLSASLKVDFDFLNTYCGYMENCIADEKTFLSEKEDRLWFILIAALYKNICNLFYALEVPEWLESTWKEIKGNDSKNKKFEISQGKETKNKSDFPLKDFKEEIFESSFLTNDMGTFMRDVCEKCWIYMNDLQRLGYAFYQSMEGKSLIRGDLLQSNYEEFGKEICQLFRFIAFECQTVWLQMVHGILPILGNVKTWLKKYFERRIREYGEVIISKLNNFDSELTSSFNKNICNMLNQLLILDNRLLPLYGYPRNNPLLTTLEDEVVKKTAELELIWEIFIHNYGIKLKSIRQLCTEDNEVYNNLKFLYEECKNSISVEKLGKSLINFIDTVLDKRGFIKKIEEIFLETSDDKEAHFSFPTILCNNKGGKVVHPEKEILKFNHLERELMDADKYFTKIKEIIRRETTNFPLTVENTIDMTKKDWMNLAEPKLGLLSDFEEFEEIMANQMKRIKTIYRDIKEFLNSKTNIHKEILLEWFDKWKENLAKILKLYAVKYRQDDDSSNPLSQSINDQGKNQRK